MPKYLVKSTYTRYVFDEIEAEDGDEALVKIDKIKHSEEKKFEGDEWVRHEVCDDEYINHH